MDLVSAVPAAAARIAPTIRRTPVEANDAFAPPEGGRLWLKLENHQRTGSFKLRGATNKLLCLSSEARARGVVAASTGNHGMAVALAARELGSRAIVYAPENAAASKLDGVRALGAEVRQVGADCIEAEAAARAHSEAHSLSYVSPYNDEDVIAGQGTLGLELHEQLERLDTLYIAVGGGGLAGGVAGYLASARPELEVVGCSPRASAVMAASVEAGRLLELDSAPTLSDGTAGGVEAGSISFPLCRDHIDRWVLVEEEAIAAAMRELVGRCHQLVEGAAAMALAAYLGERERHVGREVAVVLCGANADADVLARVLGGSD